MAKFTNARTGRKVTVAEPDELAAKLKGQKTRKGKTLDEARIKMARKRRARTLAKMAASSRWEAAA